MCERDYSLLRPFDLEAAENGELVTSINSGNIYKFVAKGGPDNFNVIRDKSGNLKFILSHFLRMAPLCWVEGKPVYKGDVLYGKWNGANPTGYVIGGVDDDGIPIHERNGCPLSDTLDEITWTPPKVKREGWINIYERVHHRGRLSIAFVSDAFPTRKDADDAAANNRKACIHIKWEE